MQEQSQFVIYDTADVKLEQIILKMIPPAWEGCFKNVHPNLVHAAKMIDVDIRNGEKISPSIFDIFKVFSWCPPEKVKVVILGQDPYYSLTNTGKMIATGVSFECAGDAIQPSLSTVFRVLKKTIKGFETPETGNLENWLSQGVLLLNTCLTTCIGKALCHEGLWQRFTKNIFSRLQQNKNVVYMLWGRHAQKFEKIIDTTQNLVLKSSHPAARGKYNTMKDCNHFNEANYYFKQHDKEQINWHL